MPDTIKISQKTMDAVDIPKINENYDILQKMLHLDNPLRKLLEIQMIGLEEEE